MLLLSLPQPASLVYVSENQYSFLNSIPRRRPVECLGLEKDVWRLEGTRSDKEYFVALLKYVFAFGVFKKEPARAQDELNKATMLLVKHRDPESLALLGSILSLKVGLAQGSTLVLASRAKDYFTLAGRTEPENPRIQLLDALNLLFTPREFGGGAKNALPALLRAMVLFEREKPSQNPWKPSWGKIECQGWLSWAYLELKDFERAKRIAEQARQNDPTYWIITDLVFPALNAHKSGGR